MKRLLALLLISLTLISLRAERFEFIPLCNISGGETKPNIMSVIFVHEGNEWSVIYDVLGTETSPDKLSCGRVIEMDEKGKEYRLSFVSEYNDVIYIGNTGYIGIASLDKDSGEVEITALSCIENFDSVFARMERSLKEGAAESPAYTAPAAPSDSTVNRQPASPSNSLPYDSISQRQIIRQSALDYARSIFGWNPDGFTTEERAEQLQGANLNYDLSDIGFILTFGAPEGSVGHNPQYILEVTDAPGPDYARLFIYKPFDKKMLFSWVFFFNGPDMEDEAFEFCKAVGRQFERNGCRFAQAPPMAPGSQLTSTELDGMKIVFGIYRSPNVCNVRIDHYK